jgi:hypothetical protein
VATNIWGRAHVENGLNSLRPQPLVRIRRTAFAWGQNSAPKSLQMSGLRKSNRVARAHSAGPRSTRTSSLAATNIWGRSPSANAADSLPTSTNIWGRLRVENGLNSLEPKPLVRIRRTAFAWRPFSAPKSFQMSRLREPDRASTGRSTTPASARTSSRPGTNIWGRSPSASAADSSPTSTNIWGRPLVENGLNSLEPKPLVRIRRTAFAWRPFLALKSFQMSGLRSPSRVARARSARPGCTLTSSSSPANIWGRSRSANAADSLPTSTNIWGRSGSREPADKFSGDFSAHAGLRTLWQGSAGCLSSGGEAGRHPAGVSERRSRPTFFVGTRFGTRSPERASAASLGSRRKCLSLEVDKGWCSHEDSNLKPSDP